MQVVLNKAPKDLTRQQFYLLDLKSGRNTRVSKETVTERRSSAWDIRNAPRNYVSLVAYQAASAVLSFGAVWIITHHLGSEGYGGIVAIIAASQVAQVLVNWTTVATVRFGVDEFVETEKIARTFWLRFLILTANFALVAGLSPFWFPVLADWLKLGSQSFWLVMAHFAVSAFWIHAQMSLQGAKLMRKQGLLQMIERVFILVGLIGLVATASLTPSSAVISYTVGSGAAMLIALFILRTFILAPFAIDGIFVRKFIAYSIPLLPYSIVGYFSGTYVDAVFVANFLSTRDLGIYSVATQISGIVLQLPTLANTLLLPLFVTLQRETESQRASNYFANVVPTLTLMWGLACTTLGFAGYLAIPLIFGHEFKNSTMPLWILLTAGVIAFPGGIGYSAMSNATSTTYISLIAAAVSGVVNIAANFVLIPKYGLVGSAVATVAAFFVSVAAFTLLLPRVTKTPISWTYAALVPSVAGASTAYAAESPWSGLAVCVAGSFFIAWLYRDSLAKTLGFLQIFGQRSPL